MEQLKNELRKKKQASYEDLVQKQKQILMKLQEKGLPKEEKTKLMKVNEKCFFFVNAAFFERKVSKLIDGLMSFSLVLTFCRYFIIVMMNTF